MCVNSIGENFSYPKQEHQEQKETLIKDWPIEGVEQFVGIYCGNLRKAIHSQLTLEFCRRHVSEHGATVTTHTDSCVFQDHLKLLSSYDLFLQYFCVLYSDSPY